MSIASFASRNATVSDVAETFADSISVVHESALGDYNQLTFELDRSGTFVIAGNNLALQKSNSYLDSGWMRSTAPLPATYKITAVVGNINYPLSNLDGLSNDPNYSEGPLNENGVYLLAITDTLPTPPHTNAWWHEHRKVVIDVDNNIWDWGMPNPIFMVYFDTSNALHSFNGETNSWTTDWINGIHYEANTFYRVEIEKTATTFVLRVFTEAGSLLEEATVNLSSVLSGTLKPEYLVIGDPHENYYQGQMSIKSITMPVIIGCGSPLVSFRQQP